MSSAISKQQPMRPALSDVIDSCNGTEHAIDSVVSSMETIEESIGEGFSQEHTIAQAIADADQQISNVNDLIAELEAEEHFYLYDFAEEYEAKTVLPISDSTPVTGSNRFSITIPENLQADWKVASLLKWELFNGNTRVDGILVYQTTMGGQTQLAAAFKTSGDASASVTRFSGEILLLKREES